MYMSMKIPNIFIAAVLLHIFLILFECPCYQISMTAISQQNFEDTDNTTGLQALLTLKLPRQSTSLNSYGKSCLQLIYGICPSAFL